MFISILEDMPLLIKKYLPMERLTELHKQHCLDKPNENDWSLVLIDGQRFEFYIPTENDDNDQLELYPLMFDEITQSIWYSSESQCQHSIKPYSIPESTCQTFSKLQSWPQLTILCGDYIQNAW
jgi:hypothetical protein